MPITAVTRPNPGNVIIPRSTRLRNSADTPSPGPPRPPPRPWPQPMSQPTGPTRQRPIAARSPRTAATPLTCANDFAGHPVAVAPVAGGQEMQRGQPDQPGLRHTRQRRTRRQRPHHEPTIRTRALREHAISRISTIIRERRGSGTRAQEPDCMRVGHAGKGASWRRAGRRGVGGLPTRARC